MPRDDKPSWSQRSGRTSQREFRNANGRARRMRRDMTPAEQRLWTALRMLNREGFHFRLQPAVAGKVYDFGDHSAALLIEVDGGVHERLPEVVARDAEKTSWAAANGYSLLRLPNRRAFDDLGQLMGTIRSAVSSGEAPHAKRARTTRRRTPDAMLDQGTAAPRTVSASINFVIPGEKVVFYPTDRKRSYMPFEEHVVPIGDVRPIKDELSFEGSGFVLLERPTAVKDFDAPGEIEAAYYSEIEALVKGITGAEKVLVFGHVVRSDDPATKDGSLPSFGAHVDYGDFTTREFATNILGKDEAEKWLRRRYVFMNLWRPITTVERSPLALCDPRTVAAGHLYGSEVRGGLNDPDRPPLYGFNLAHAEGQRWWYAPRMRPEEIWAFKIHDSKPGAVGGVPHTAFNDPSSPEDAKPRKSIEVRTISFFPE